MMKALLALAALALQPPPAPEADWLVGTWVWTEEDQSELPDCNGAFTITYAPDGTYAFIGERGDWQLDGERLIEIARYIDPQHWRSSAVGEIGQPWIARLEPLDDDSFRKVYADGTSLIFHRCPPAHAPR